jgi:serine/threonine protein kinase
MEIKHDTAAHALEGLTLLGKWNVLKKIEPNEGATGGFFSVCYSVTDGLNKAFLKALNFQAFFQMFQDKPIVEIIREQTEAYQYEVSLLERCKNNKLSKVAMILDRGEEYLSQFPIPNVPYLIFEMAQGDLRSHISFSKDLDEAWKLKSIHNVAVGLKQLHNVGIGHQDLKPSNVLLYKNGLVSKIGDLGRSLCFDIEAPHENGSEFTGDLNYAPPEFLYRYEEPDIKTRIRSADMYLFGSLVVFYFTGLNMTALLAKNLDRTFRWNNWVGTFEEVKPYLIDGYNRSLNEFKRMVRDIKAAEDLCKVVEYCCYPLPEKRGHPRTIFSSLNKDGEIKDNFNPYNFERIVSLFARLSHNSYHKYL